MRRVYLLLLFFLSGISGLIYQIAWVRQATLTFGISVYAYSAVLTAFMLGLAVGSYGMGRWADRTERPLHIYALVEIGIAMVAILTPVILVSLDGFYATVNRSFQPALGWLTLLRLVLSIVVLTPATALIGATLPLMSRIYATQVGRVGSDVGRLYLANTIGAALGCFLTGVFFIRLLGLRETVFLGATLNLLVAVGALAMAQFAIRRDRRGDLVISGQESVASGNEAPLPEGRRRAVSSAMKLTRGALRYVAVGYAISGFAALGYEVVWARILYIHTSHAVYSFSLMLTVFLFGLAGGSALGASWLRRHRATLGQFGGLQLGIGILAVAVLLVFARLPSFHLDRLFNGYTVPYELSIATVTLFPPTFLMGLLFPVVASLYTRERTAWVGLRIGTVNALNTLGAILGSLATGFALIPLLGLRNATLFLAGINLSIGAGALWLKERRRPVLRWAPAAVLGLPVLAGFLVPPGIYLGPFAHGSENVVFYEEGIEATVAVLEFPERDFKISFVNGRDEVLTDERSMLAFRLLGHLPALLRPGARNALVLSFGNGLATGALATHPIRWIDAVDLSSEMIEAAKLFSEENYDVLQNPRVHLHVEDARNFLLQTDLRYDIITVDATHPVNASSWALFTREFYRLVSERLAPGGIFMQWVPRFALEDANYRSILRTARSVFPHTTLWSTDGIHTFIVSTPERFTPSSLQAVMAEAVKHPLVMDGLGPPFIMARYFRMSEEALARYVAAGRIVTDNDAYFMPVRGTR